MLSKYLLDWKIVASIIGLILLLAGWFFYHWEPLHEMKQKNIALQKELAKQKEKRKIEIIKENQRAVEKFEKKYKDTKVVVPDEKIDINDSVGMHIIVLP